jgi:hypothetical protein
MFIIRGLRCIEIDPQVDDPLERDLLTDIFSCDCEQFAEDPPRRAAAESLVRKGLLRRRKTIMYDLTPAGLKLTTERAKEWLSS